ncbi:MAG TPA: non-canonical purine NTP pyrophosphatase, RdgB/HAM1 family [Lachnospiraceae bacterium]|nr:non-canonical purine NTP pyrophosphatase, RdgB/HAM1 family [Lachnospiraceae bacterium]
MSTIVFATTNKDKVREISEITAGSDVNILTMSDIGYVEDIVEDGTTFTENATIKAKAVADYINTSKTDLKGAIVLADDSGLEIDYYDKKPGIMSHRWLGDRTYTQAMQDVLKDMEGVPDDKRTARFVCSMAAVLSDGQVITVLDTIEGIVGHEIIGDNGFGYDPFFYVPELGCTTAQLSTEDKNKISHRGKALRNIIGKLKDAGLI